MTTPVDFDGDWHGWRLRGRHLVSPDGQRITRTRLEGLLWRDESELHRAGFISRKNAEANKHARRYGAKVKVVIVDLADYRVGGVTAG